MSSKEKEALSIISGVIFGFGTGLYILFNNINETIQALHSGEDEMDLVVFILAFGIAGFTLLGCMTAASLVTLSLLRLAELVNHVKGWRNNK